MGYGDINAGNTLERLISCILMFVGVFFYSFTIGTNLFINIILMKNFMSIQNNYFLKKVRFHLF